MKLIIVIVMVGIMTRLMPELTTLWIRVRSRLKRSYSRFVYDENYIDGKSFYLERFKIIPSTTYLNNIDAKKVFAYVKEVHKDKLVEVYQSCFFNWDEGRQESSETYFILRNKVLIELGRSYTYIYFTHNGYEFVNDVINVLNQYKLPGKQEDFEINIITMNNGLELKRMDIKPTQLDVDLYYNSDFKEVDALIRERLNKVNNKGIVLLHGLPGTGKTTYLRHLIGEVKKKILFVSPSVAGNLMNPDFIDLLIDNPNAVLVIEDAENIIMDRKYNSDSSVSNLLNLSDGLLSDCLNVQIICTFNSSLNMIDSALMRKGRLIAKYEFGKLEVKKAQKLSDHLGFDSVITEPMTLAEIANQNDKAYQANKIEVVGFRRKEVAMN